MARSLSGLDEIRDYLKTQPDPIFFVSRTAFNLIGLDRYVDNFFYVSLYDSWDGANPRLFSPPDDGMISSDKSIGEINKYLLGNSGVQDFIASKGGRPKIIMLFFDTETEALCESLGYDLIMPSASLREHLDSKLVTTRIGNELGIASAPNVLTSADSWDQLREIADAHALGRELVIQTEFGDEGLTTYFISSGLEWSQYEVHIKGQDLKIMKRLPVQSLAIEAVATAAGTFVGPVLTELTGYPELTPYSGGWCGNEVRADLLTPAQQQEAGSIVRRFGDRLYEEGYRGFFEIDILIDSNDGSLYLGELNPRISGASPVTNTATEVVGGFPLMLFHILEYLDVAHELDPSQLSELWARVGVEDEWSQAIVKHVDSEPIEIAEAPLTGVYRRLGGGRLELESQALGWVEMDRPDQVFFFRVTPPGHSLERGSYLGILVTRERLQVGGELTARCTEIVDGIKTLYRSNSLDR